MGQRQITTHWNGYRFPLLLPKTFEKENLLPSQFLSKQHIEPFIKLKDYYYTPKLGK